MYVPIALFLITVAGFFLAVGYFAYTTVFGGRLVARCRVPGEALFELDPRMNPVRVAAFLSPGDGCRLPVRVELERDGDRLWSREVLPEESRGLLDETVSVGRFDVEQAGKYRIKGFGAPDGQDASAPIAAIHVYARAREPRTSVYLLAGFMLAGGFVSLLIVLA